MVEPWPMVAHHSDFSAPCPGPSDSSVRFPLSEGASMLMSLTHPAPGPGTRASRRRRVGILDLVTKSPKNSFYGRVMNANLASIMPQVLGVWCEQAGHDVSYVCFTGGDDLLEELPKDLDLLFIGAFT